MTKEELKINYFKELIENNKFNEYDIEYFFIFLRDKYLKENNIKKHKSFRDFANGVAHTFLNQGYIVDSLNKIYKNNYELDKNNKLKGFNGLKQSIMIDNLKILLDLLNIKYTDKTIHEIILCMFSILNKKLVVYNRKDKNKKSKNEKHSYLHLFIIKSSKKDSLYLTTTINKKEKDISICYSKLNYVKISKDYNKNFIDNTVIVKRENNILYLYDTIENKNILYVY